jgi:CO/xanthine dehydrogenase FAD-binding subunit
VDLHTVTEVVSPAGPGLWRDGDAWLAGGTALFSEPRPSVVRLLDLAAAGWAPLTVTAEGLEIAATCTVAEVSTFSGEPGWSAWRGLARRCCESFLASFKIWNVATVGGNLCAALPAGPMITLTAALDGQCLLLGPDGSARTLPVTDLVTGDGTTALRPGELLRAITLPRPALSGPVALRQGSLHPLGRSASLLAGRLDGGSFVLTVTASTVRPFVFRFTGLPPAEDLAAALLSIGERDWTDDVHGSPAWRRHLTMRHAEELRRELAGA